MKPSSVSVSPALTCSLSVSSSDSDDDTNMNITNSTTAAPATIFERVLTGTHFGQSLVVAIADLYDDNGDDNDNAGNSNSNSGNNNNTRSVGSARNGTANPITETNNQVMTTKGEEGGLSLIHI